jgi:hypothetical protein
MIREWLTYALARLKVASDDFVEAFKENWRIKK